MKNQKLRMLLAGAGFMGKAHFEAAQSLDNVEYIGILDANKDSAGKFSKQYGILGFSDFEEAVEKLKPDAVDICVPTSFHLPLITACAEKGVNVLCEKPLALTVADALKIKEICNRKNIRLMVAQVLRFWPEYVYAVDAAKSGKYGKILSIDCKRFSTLPGWNSWMTKPDVGGGAVLDLQIHDIDFIVQLVGMPESIYSTGRFFNGTVNAVQNKFFYSSGISVVSEASFMMPESYPFRMYFRVEFENAVMEMDFWQPKNQRLKVFPAAGEMFIPELSGKDAYSDEIAYFSYCVNDGKAFDRVPLDESINSLLLCLKSKESCEGKNQLAVL